MHSLATARRRLWSVADGSIDWLCWPRFDSAACFAALLGTTENGRWLIAPKSAPVSTNRRYRPGTLVLETEFETDAGSAAIIDFMPPAEGTDLVRIIVGPALGEKEYVPESYSPHYVLAKIRQYLLQ